MITLATNTALGLTKTSDCPLPLAQSVLGVPTVHPKQHLFTIAFIT